MLLTQKASEAVGLLPAVTAGAGDLLALSHIQF
jgi:hypothetical protein